jgi:hypothetical protein
MSATILPISSDGGFTSGGNININNGGSISTTANLTMQVPGGIPNSVTGIGASSGSWESNPSSDLATTGGSGTGLTVDVGNEGGYASSIVIHTPGSGYSNGDVISVTSGSSSAIFTINVNSNQWTFTTEGTLSVAGDISYDAVASPAPRISGFDSGMFSNAVVTGNLFLNSGNIKGGTPTVVDDGINAIYTGVTTTMDVFGFPFSLPATRGQLTISGDIDPTQALGTWYYQSTSTNAFEIFTDSTYSTPVDSTGWGAYGGGGSVAITKQIPAANIVIDSNGYLTKFSNDGQVTFPGIVNTSNISVTGNVTVSGWIDGTNTIFTGSITGNVLTVTNAVDGTIAWGQTLYGNSVLAETVITSQITFSSANPGGNGTYRLNQSQTVSSETMSVNSLYMDGDIKLAADHGIYVRDAHDPYLYDNLIGIAEVDATIFVGSINTNGLAIDNNKEYKVDSALNPGTYMAVAKVDAADQVILGSGNSANTLIRVGGDSATTGYGMKLVNGGEALIPTGLRIGDNTNSSIFGAPLEVGSILGAAANNQSSPGGIALPTYRGTGTVIPNDEWGSYLYGSRYRGTINSPLPVKNGDWLMEFGATAFDGTNNNGGGEIAIRVDGVVSGTNNPSKIEFYNTVSGANNQSLGMVLDSSQKLSVSGPVKTVATTIALLGSAATAGAGARAFATDGNLVASGNFGAVVGGSGANAVPVYSNGTNWCIG